VAGSLQVSEIANLAAIQFTFDTAGNYPGPFHAIAMTWSSDGLDLLQPIWQLTGQGYPPIIKDCGEIQRRSMKGTGIPLAGLSKCRVRRKALICSKAYSMETVPLEE